MAALSGGAPSLISGYEYCSAIPRSCQAILTALYRDTAVPRPPHRGIPSVVQTPSEVFMQISRSPRDHAKATVFCRECPLLEEKKTVCKALRGGYDRYLARYFVPGIRYRQVEDKHHPRRTIFEADCCRQLGYMQNAERCVCGKLTHELVSKPPFLVACVP